MCTLIGHVFCYCASLEPNTWLSLVSPQLSGGCELTVVIHDFMASNSNELTVRRGQTVEVLERCHDKPDWCLVRTTDRSPAQEGLVPCSMLCIAHSRSSMEMEGIFNHKGQRDGVCALQSFSFHWEVILILCGYLHHMWGKKLTICQYVYHRHFVSVQQWLHHARVVCHTSAWSRHWIPHLPRTKTTRYDILIFSLSLRQCNHLNSLCFLLKIDAAAVSPDFFFFSKLLLFGDIF